MITADQPTIFGSKVIAAVSSKQDGNMKYGLGEENDVAQNRRGFLGTLGIGVEQASLVGVTYDTDDFARYHVVTEKDKGRSMHSTQTTDSADALITEEPGHALFLPLADCVGAVLYDEEHHVLMVSHLGRHSVEVNGAARSATQLKEQFSTDLTKLKVWLSPGVGKATYPLNRFDGQSLHEVITAQLQYVGVPEKNIENSGIDTASSADYYSHSEHLKGNDESGRFAVVAMMASQGEPAS